jgi:hypothetical protein
VIHLIVTRLLTSVFGEHTHISGSVLTKNTHFSSFDDSLTIPEAKLEAAANGTLGLKTNVERRITLPSIRPALAAMRELQQCQTRSMVLRYYICADCPEVNVSKNPDDRSHKYEKNILPKD